jgi:bacterioferritin-associated ferredoxin
MIWINYRPIDFGYALRMYICICNAVTDSAIRQAVGKGVNSFRDLTFQTGCGSQCGSCVKMAREIMDEALVETGFAPSRVELRFVSAS